jgi:hypothetical protein
MSSNDAALQLAPLMEDQVEDEGADKGANQRAVSDDVLELAPTMMEEQAVSQQRMELF